MSVRGAGALEGAHLGARELSLADRAESNEDKFRGGLRPLVVGTLSCGGGMVRRRIHGSKC